MQFMFVDRIKYRLTHNADVFRAAKSEYDIKVQKCARLRKLLDAAYRNLITMVPDDKNLCDITDACIKQKWVMVKFPSDVVSVENPYKNMTLCTQNCPNFSDTVSCNNAECLRNAQNQNYFNLLVLYNDAMCRRREHWRMRDKTISKGI